MLGRQTGIKPLGLELAPGSPAPKLDSIVWRRMIDVLAWLHAVQVGLNATGLADEEEGLLPEGADETAYAKASSR